MRTTTSLLTIDGTLGEGGGQLLRTSLALALVTKTPFRMVNIRAKRSRPGLMRQHLTAVAAAAAIAEAEVSGAEIGSTEITFRPGKNGVLPGSYTFSVGTAGSTTLVLQSVLPALMLASAPSHLVLEGGTHNPLSPPFDFFAQALLPVLGRMGPRVEARLERSGFYPAGGGRIGIDIEPVAKLSPLELTVRGEVRSKRARALLSALPKEIAERELAALGKRLGWEASCLSTETVRPAFGPGNVLLVEIECDHVTEVFSGFGEKGISAEKIAYRVAEEVSTYLTADVPVGEYMADQLLLPMALAGKGAFLTVEPSRHTTTQIDLLAMFVGTAMRVEPARPGAWAISIA